MDDFGGIWERDYGLGRRNRSSSGRTNYDSTRFSDSFSRGKRQNEVLNKGRTYSSPAKYSSNMGSSTYSYNMYSEIFSSNVHSTIPVFEDVFRVPRPRTKVSDIRENEIFRGIPSALRKNSRVTYEDIFADDVSSGPFLFSDVAGSRLTVASSRTASSSGTPRRDSAESPTMEVRNGNDHAAAFKVQRLSKKAPEENGQDKKPRQELNTNCLTKQEELNMDGLTKQQQLNLDGLVKKEDLILDGLPRQEQLNSTQQDQEELNSKSLPEEQNSLPKQEFNSESLPKQELNSNIQELKCEGSVKQELNASVNHEGLAKQDLNSTLPSESPGVETREWLSVGEVNLTTKPSEIPPPVRLPPSRSASAEIWFETSEADSGPPPSRVPPPVETSVSELLERNIKGKSQHAEMSIREKVLDWQKHNLKEELMMKSSRSETLIRAPKKRAEVERIEAEVEHLMAAQARARAERAKVDARQGGSHAKGLKVNDAKGTEGGHGKGSEVIEGGHGKGSEIDGLVQGDEKGEKGERVADAVLETDGGDATGLGVEQNGHATVFDVKQGGHAKSVDVEGSKDEKGDKGENVVTEEGGKDEKGDEYMVTNNDDGDGQGGNSTSSRDLPASETQAPEDADAVREEEHPKSETESTISMATISSEEAVTNGKLKEETAPETPERLDKVHPRHEENKSSETEIPEDAMEFAWKELDVTKKQEEDRGDARRIEERTLVARITAEVRERAALEAKARAESASRIAEQRRTKPRLKEQHQEYVAKELEDSRESSKNLRRAKLSLREQLERERLTRIENERVQQQQSQTKAQRDDKQRRIGIEKGRGEIVKAEGEAKGDKTETFVEKITSEARERAEREKAERERLERLDRARERERERLERLEKERERERREQEREREIEREKDRVGLEEKAARERAAAEEAARVKMERAAVERATAEARARAFERAAASASSNDSSRPTSVPKQRFGNSASMPSNGAQPSENGGIRRATSSTNLETDRYSSSSSSNNRDFEQEFLQELKGETPERRKARLERFQRTQNRAAQALAQKNQRDLEMQSEQAERQRLSERLDGEIKRWSVGKDGNIRALLSTLQYVLWPDSGWKQLTLTELITPAAVKKAYRRATLCVHPDKMQQKHASVQQKYIAEKVFHILQVAWNRFNSQAGL